MLLLALALGSAALGKPIPANGKLKIFIMSGQSNMIGFGQLAGSPGTMETALKGNVAGVETRGFQRKPEESPSKQVFHWLRNWETLYLIGKSMGDAMLVLESGSATNPR